jgi:hypothetical protein
MPTPTIKKSPTNEYVALMTFGNVDDPVALRYELTFALRAAMVNDGDFAIQIEPIVPHCGLGNN